MSDFTHELSKVHEQHADDLHNLVEAFGRKSAEFRPSCPSSLFATWEAMLQEVETDSQVRAYYSTTVKLPYLLRVFKKKEKINKSR